MVVDGVARSIQIADRLPTFRVPLRMRDVDVALDLQPLLDDANEMGRHYDLDHMVDPPPPMDPDDVAWSDTLPRAAGRRPSK